MLRMSIFVTANPYYVTLYIQIISDVDKVFVNLLVAVKRPRLMALMEPLSSHSYPNMQTVQLKEHYHNFNL